MRTSRLAPYIIISLFWVEYGYSQQSIHDPTKSPPPSSQAEDSLIREGLIAHDRQDYDHAIARYEAALQLNPSSPLAMFELAFTYSTKGEHQKSLEFAYQVAEYDVPFLDQVYTLIGNELDLLGKVEDAIAVYKIALDRYPNKYLIHYNLGVALVEAGKSLEGKDEFKTAMTLKPSHASSHFLLGKICEAQGSRVPALLAYCRFLILQPVSQRTRSVQESIRRLVFGTVEKDSQKENTFNINVDVNQPTDDGDFRSMSLLLSLNAAYQVGEHGKDKTEVEQLTDSFNRIFAIIGETTEKESQRGFAWEYYIPYFMELKNKDYVDAFVDHAFQNNNISKEKISSFLKWSTDFEWQSAAR